MPFASDLDTTSTPHRSKHQRKKQSLVLAEFRSGQRIQVRPKVPAGSHGKRVRVNIEAMRSTGCTKMSTAPKPHRNSKSYHPRLCDTQCRDEQRNQRRAVTDHHNLN